MQEGNGVVSDVVNTNELHMPCPDNPLKSRATGRIEGA